LACRRGIIDQVPLAPVGKVFKPALRWQAIQQVYARELSALGDMASAVEINVGEDKRHGAMARIKVTPASGVDASAIENRVNALLARYTVRYAVEIG